MAAVPHRKPGPGSGFWTAGTSWAAEKRPTMSSGRYPKANGIEPSARRPGITSRPARRSGRYILRSRSWMPTGHCSVTASVPRAPM